MCRLSHSVNIAVTAGVIVFDDRGECVQALRLPYVTLFFWLPALAFRGGWLRWPRLPRWSEPGWWAEVVEAGRFFWRIYFGGGVYWQLIQ